MFCWTEKAEEATGSILGTAGLSYTGDNLDFHLDAGISVHSPNTTGILRLAGMNKNGFDLPVSADFLYPAALPETNVTISGIRGKLFYRDYHEYDSAGSSTLRHYNNWTPPEDQIYAYEDGGRTGPYIAGTDSEIEGNAAVFEYDLGNSEWTGGRIPITLGSQALDLSGTQSISLKWKHIAGTDNVKIYLRIGKLAEDLDSDGILDEETSEYATGFNFDDGLFIDMRVGLSPDSNSGNGQIDTEDLDGNDILDGEGSNLVLTMEESIDFVAPVPGLDLDSDWDTLTLNFSAADREMIKAVTGFEIIIVDEGGGSSGRLLMGDITFSGSSFVAKHDTGTVNVREINELYSSAPEPLLTANFPEISIFSSGTGAQNIAEMSWDTSGTWEATTFTEAVNLSDYNKISFYMKTPNPAPDNVTFALTNPSGNGISLTFPPVESSEWVKYTVDYRNGNLTADNSTLAVSTWNSMDANEINVNRLTLSADCSSEGTLLLDEVHLEDPVVGVSGAVSSIFTYRKSGTILDINGTSLLSNLNFSNSSRVIGQNFASGFTNSNDSTIFTASNLSINLLAMRINGNLDLQWQDLELYSSPGVSFTIPFLENRITINDSYNEVNIPLAESVIRENSIVAKAGISSIKLQGGSVYSSQNLIRTWGVSTNTIWEKGSRLSTDLDLSMYSEEDPYEHMNSFEKLASSYELFIPGDIHNDRTTNISINPEINTNSASFGINETFGSNISGLDKRILATGQSLSVDAEFTFNSESPGQFSITPGYEKIINSQIDENTDSNFFTDTKDSILHLGTHDYYFTGIPLWEIIDPEFGNQFIKNTEGQRNTEYIPEFSLRFTRLAGSHLSDIIIPSIVNINVSRYLTRDFDSITDKLKVNLETRATALNVFGKLGSTPLVSWYQTEEITNILSIGGEYKSYMTDVLEDPVFNLNHTLYLNFNINKQDSVDLESSHNWTWMPLDWNSSTSGSYNWQVESRKPIKIPLLYKEESEGKPYFEHIEKLTVSTSIRDEQKEYSLTLTANHTTNLIISDTGIISLYAGIGWDQKNITTGDVTTKYYLLGIEAGISAKLTF